MVYSVPALAHFSLMDHSKCLYNYQESLFMWTKILADISSFAAINLYNKMQSDIYTVLWGTLD